MPISTRFVKSMPLTNSRKPWTKCCRDCSPSVMMSMPASSCCLMARSVASSFAVSRSAPASRHGAHSLPGSASHDGLGRLPAILVGNIFLPFSAGLQKFADVSDKIVCKSTDHVGQVLFNPLCCTKLGAHDG